MICGSSSHHNNMRAITIAFSMGGVCRSSEKQKFSKHDPGPPSDHESDAAVDARIGHITVVIKAIIQILPC